MNDVPPSLEGRSRNKGSESDGGNEGKLGEHFDNVKSREWRYLRGYGSSERRE